MSSCVDQFKDFAGAAIVDKVQSAMDQAIDPAGLVNRTGISTAQLTAARDVVNNGLASMKGLLDIPPGTLDQFGTPGAILDQLTADTLGSDLSDVSSAIDDFTTAFPACAGDATLGTLQGLETRMTETVASVNDIDTAALEAAKEIAAEETAEIASQVSDADDVYNEFGF